MRGEKLVLEDNTKPSTKLWKWQEELEYIKVKLDGTNMLRNECDCSVSHHSLFSEHVHGYVLIDNIGVISLPHTI